MYYMNAFVHSILCVTRVICVDWSLMLSHSSICTSEFLTFQHNDKNEVKTRKAMLIIVGLKIY